MQLMIENTPAITEIMVKGCGALVFAFLLPTVHEGSRQKLLQFVRQDRLSEKGA